MPSFFINLLKLLRAVVTGVKEDKEFGILLFLLAILLTSATIFYSGTEGWRVVDALYFSVMTMATIGYGDFVPTTDIGKIFTIIFTFLSVGVFISLNTKIVLITVNQKKEALLKRKLKKEDEDTK
ncbi:two pore domain potassium channel family protein [Leucothrix sargassi]|nr:two pore domain potassium channel family protein [Leucothrix sargassi]